MLFINLSLFCLGKVVVSHEVHQSIGAWRGLNSSKWIYLIVGFVFLFFVFFYIQVSKISKFLNAGIISKVDGKQGLVVSRGTRIYISEHLVMCQISYAFATPSWWIKLLLRASRKWFKKLVYSNIWVEVLWKDEPSNARGGTSIRLRLKNLDFMCNFLKFSYFVGAPPLMFPRSPSPCLTWIFMSISACFFIWYLHSWQPLKRKQRRHMTLLR